MKNQLSILLFLLSISVCFSQNDKNNSKYSLDVLTGFITNVNNSNAQVGPPPIFPIKLPPNFGSKPVSLILHRSLSSKFSVGLQTGYNAFDLSKGNNSAVKKWKTFSVTVGPEYKVLEKGNFSMQVYGRIGASFMNIPESKFAYPNTDVITDSFAKSSTTALEGKVGTSLSYKLSKSLRFITNVEYAKNSNNSIAYQTRDISSAVRPDFVDQDLANSIPFEAKKMGLSNLSFNFGVHFNFTQIKRKRPGRTKYSNITLKKSQGEDGDDNTPANNHNTSRSNKRHPVAGDENIEGKAHQVSWGENARNGQDDNDENGNPPTINANDWNSTRSNKTSKTSRVANPEGEDNGDGNPPPTNANDYGSTRSNRQNDDADAGSTNIEGKEHQVSWGENARNDQGEDNRGGNPPATQRGKRKAKRDCLNSGGTFSEKPNGTYFCYKQLSMARVGSTTPYQAFKGGKRKCWRAGGTWMTNSHGSWCANATKTQ